MGEVIYDNSIEARQRYFDITATNLMTRTNGRSIAAGMAEGAYCLYEAPDGNRCAVGIHFPDGDEYAEAKAINGGVLDVLDSFAELDGVIVPIGYTGHQLAEALQRAHDLKEHWTKSGTMSAEGIEFLRTVADQFSLEFGPELEALTESREALIS